MITERHSVPIFRSNQKLASHLESKPFCLCCTTNTHPKWKGNFWGISSSTIHRIMYCELDEFPKYHSNQKTLSHSLPSIDGRVISIAYLLYNSTGRNTRLVHKRGTQEVYRPINSKKTPDEYTIKIYKNNPLTHRFSSHSQWCCSLGASTFWQQWTA